MVLRAKRFVTSTRGDVAVLAAMVGILLLGLAAFAGVARAVPCQTGSATITAVGETCYTVSAGVSAVRVVAVGAQGGAGSGCGVGGFGAQVAGTLPVTPGDTLWAEVAGQGGAGSSAPSAGPGGANGGGTGGNGGTDAGGGGGGGGASDVRLQQASVSLGSADSRLLVAGGGGGTGAFNIGCSTAGAGGLFATAGGSTDFASGGKPGSATGGGAFGGSNGSCASITAATSGTLGTGGTGASSPQNNCGGGGGGGGGYFGGGGGGTDGTPGGSGGGAGSSYVNSVLTAASMTTATQTTGKVTITPLVATVSVGPAGSQSFPGTQPMQTVSSPITLTITDTGTGPLQISSLTFAGTDPQDFLISSNGCVGQLAAGASCTLGVNFAPQGQGARSATLQIASNAQGSPAAVPLSGNGGSLPQGPPGQNGATGKTGAAGPGREDPAGRVHQDHQDDHQGRQEAEGHRAALHDPPRLHPGQVHDQQQRQRRRVARRSHVRHRRGDIDRRRSLATDTHPSPPQPPTRPLHADTQAPPWPPHDRRTRSDHDHLTAVRRAAGSHALSCPPTQTATPTDQAGHGQAGEIDGSTRRRRRSRWRRWVAPAAG